MLEHVWPSSQTLLAVLFPPALAALLSGYLVSRWKGRSDYVEKRLDELCDKIGSTAESASSYWLINQVDPEARMLEARVLAGNMHVAGLRAILESHISESGKAELQRAERNFMRELTGGDFGVHNRTADFLRAGRCYSAASQYIVRIRAMRLGDLKGLRTRR